MARPHTQRHHDDGDRPRTESVGVEGQPLDCGGRGECQDLPINSSWAGSRAHYRSASILKNRRVVFNVKGNEYRLIVAVAYKIGVVYVKFVGTHAQYDAIDAETVEIE